MSETMDSLEASENTSVLTKPLFPRPGPGRMGVVAARAGVGKSACLVRIALGDLIGGRQVLHVSLDNPVTDVRASYDAKLKALSRLEPGATPIDLRLEVEQRRVIHCFLGGTFQPEKLDEAIGFLKAHTDFHPATIVLDGYLPEHATVDEIRELAQVAQRAEAELWMSARTHREEPCDETSGLPVQLSRLAHLLEVVVCLEPSGEEILVHLLKRGDRLGRERLPVRMDPSSMLLVHDAGVLET
jgi:hypothetical protein